jgi:hypothetical protein
VVAITLAVALPAADTSTNAAALLLLLLSLPLWNFTTRPRKPQRFFPPIILQLLVLGTSWLLL